MASEELASQEFLMSHRKSMNLDLAPSSEDTKWAQSIAPQDVRKFAESCGGRMVTLDMCVGPCIRSLWYALALTLITPTFALLLGVAMGSCDEAGVVRFPTSYIWAIMSPLIVAHLYIESKCFRSSAIPFSHWALHYQIFGKQVAFSVFAHVGVFNSIVYLMGLVTHSIFTATWIISERDCPLVRDNTIMQISFSQSRLLWFLTSVRIEPLVLTVWVLTEFKLVYTMLRVCPRTGEPTIGGTPGSEIKHYQPLYGTKQSNGSLFTAVADATGMMTISGQRLAYRKKMFKHHMSADDDDEGNEYARRNLELYLQAVSFRLVLLGVLRVALPLSLQITMLSVKYATLPWNMVRGGDVFSILIAFAGALPVLVTGVETLLFWRNSVPAVLSGEWRFRKIMWRIRSALVAFAFTMAWAAAKFTMFFVCQNRLWNVAPPWTPTSGCVVLPRSLAGDNATSWQ